MNTELSYSLGRGVRKSTATTSKPLSSSCSVQGQTPGNTYTNFFPVGCGTFGTVFKAKCEQTGETVAIKKVYQDRRYKNRELSILLELNHINTIKILNHFYTQKNSNERYLNVVMQYFPETLCGLIKKKETINPTELKIYSYQMFHALNYLNAIGICHRDIKPQNILIDQKRKLLQMCDFGSAKRLNANENNVSYICSRYYRAPELIFNAERYTNAIDTWSVGCVIAELVLGYPIFQGENSTDQLIEIIKVCGTPTKKQIELMNPNYSDYKFPLIKCYPLKEVFKKYHSEEHFLDLMKRIFVYSPNQRIKPIEALCHPFFDELREEEFLNKYNVSEILFSFSDEEKKAYGDIIERKLIPEKLK